MRWPTVTKELDLTQGPGFTAPNTFLTNSTVRYRLTAACSSNTVDCGIGTITDVLDPNLTFQSVVKPTTSLPLSSSYDSASRTVTITIGNASTKWPDGNSLEFVIVARVNSTASGSIPNQAHITTPGGTNDSQIVTISTPPPVPDWYLDKVQVAPNSTTSAVGENVTYQIDLKVPNMLGNVDIASGTLVDTYPAGATVVSTIPAGVVDTALLGFQRGVMVGSSAQLGRPA